MEIRLQKRIADCGYCSRRKAEDLIVDGKVKVNGKVVTKLGTKVSPEDKVQIGDKTLSLPKEQITIALHKPADYITTKSDPHHNKTVMDLLPKELQHLKPAGRLDKESEGLLILSTDGELIQKLTHPGHKHTKTYEVKVKGIATSRALAPLTTNKLKLDKYQLNPMQFEIMRTTKDRKTWIRLILSEGRKRQIRRVMDSLGFPVIYLRRTEIGDLTLENLDKGDYRILTKSECSKASSHSY